MGEEREEMGSISTLAEELSSIVEMPRFKKQPIDLTTLEFAVDLEVFLPRW